MLAILESRRSGWLSILTEEFEGNTEDEDAAIVELVAAAIVELVAAIVSVTDGSDTMKSFDTYRKTQRITRNTQWTRRIREEDRRTQRERERLREKISSWLKKKRENVFIKT